MDKHLSEYTEVMFLLVLLISMFLFGVVFNSKGIDPWLRCVHCSLVFSRVREDERILSRVFCPAACSFPLIC